MKAEDGIGNLFAFMKFSRPQRSQVFDVIPIAKRAYITRDDITLPYFKVKHNYFKKCFFHSTVIEWNKLDLSIHDSEIFTSF